MNLDMNPDSRTEGILVIQTGGTIDKDYPKRKGGYAFEIAECAARRIFEKIEVAHTFLSVCKKDSQDITDVDRNDLMRACRDADQSKILITHGTDTMIQTAQYIARECLSKTIVFTGSFLPETFKASDAEFNVGFALLLGIGLIQMSQ
ncbi:hypothetical protein ScPMuIL_013596 [Solemya velum]